MEKIFNMMHTNAFNTVFNVKERKLLHPLYEVPRVKRRSISQILILSLGWCL